MEFFSTAAIKSLQYVASPLGLMTCVLFACLVCFLLRWKKTANVLLFSALALFWLSSAPLPNSLLKHWFYTKHAISPMAKGSQQDVIVVAGWARPISKDDIDLKRFWSQRLWVAAQRYTEHPSPIIVISSQYPPPRAPLKDELRYSRQKLLELGVLADDIIDLPPSRSTHESLVEAFNELHTRNLNDVLLVGYARRLPRKNYSLQHLFGLHGIGDYSIRVVAADSVSRRESVPLSELRSWLPTESALTSTSMLTHEIFALLVYRLNGWI